MGDLLQDVLASMQEDGDTEEAEELRQLAACVGLEGSLDSLGMPPCQPRKKRRRHCLDGGGAPATAASSSCCGSSSSGSEGETEVPHSLTAAERSALELVLTELYKGSDFPVEQESR